LHRNTCAEENILTMLCEASGLVQKKQNNILQQSTKPPGKREV
jgi:hypothetical protein